MWRVPTMGVCVCVFTVYACMHVCVRVGQGELCGINPPFIFPWGLWMELASSSLRDECFYLSNHLAGPKWHKFLNTQLNFAWAGSSIWTLWIKLKDVNWLPMARVCGAFLGKVSLGASPYLLPYSDRRQKWVLVYNCILWAEPAWHGQNKRYRMTRSEIYLSCRRHWVDSAREGGVDTTTEQFLEAFGSGWWEVG